MVQYRDLNAPPPRMLADVVADMKAQERQSKTGDAGVKDLGESGDVVWPRPDGTPVSVRDVDLDLADARQRIEDAEGDLAGAQARIDTALDAEGHVREDEILRNATLLGETVVEQINVTEKLVGTDGVFTGTVDFANVNVTGELLANEISGEYLYGTVVEGGEIRTGSDGSRGSFLLGDRAYVSPVDGYASPGLQLEAPGREYTYPPGLGIDGGSVSVSSGRATDGRYGQLQVNHGGVSAVVSPAPGDTAHWGSRFSVDNTRARLSAGNPASIDRAEVLVSGPVILNGQEVSNAAVRLEVRHNGELSRIEAGGGTTVVEASDGTTKRSLKVDGNGVWATEGSAQVSLIPQVRPFQYSALWNMDLSPSPILVQHLPGGKLCQAQARIQNLTGSSLSLPHDTWVTLNLNPIPPDLRGGYTDYIDITHAQNSARGRLEMNYSTGAIRVKSLERDKNGNPVTINWTNNNSIWFPMRWFVPN